MQLTSLLLPLVAVGAIAWAPNPNCLSMAEAESLVSNYSYSLGLPGNASDAYNATLDAIALPTYQEISDSIDILAGMPLGSVTFASRSADEANHTVSQAIYERETLNLYVACNVITWRWKFTLFPGALPVQGVNIFVTEGGLLNTTYIEFNSLAWAIDVGYTVTPPPGPPAAKARLA